MEQIEYILQQVKEGSLNVDHAKKLLLPYEDLEGFAKLDHFRQGRTGFPEVVFGEGKTVHQIINIINSLMKTNRRVLATRIDELKAHQIQAILPMLTYHPVAKALTWVHSEEPEVLYDGYVAIVCAGTSDLPVGEEAAITAEAFGCKTERIYDVGVAGIHRLFHQLERIENASATVVIAGMEGALASVVGGLISNPIVAVPTSIGYGANFQGLSALLSMLNTCSPGISVVNIDNGFGAGYYAALINQKTSNKKGTYRNEDSIF
ncbi:nickel pincer cofactor biosynthesis protein LarB [Mesobacillus subterraneus]|uniref:PurE domain-containing protein n=1 Tax=Mesobacillus subterraneus TaxID=285983 RepID=A0A0D6ZES5_9BACI|nr:nickel pincer cofactor biosynthesis protein LarB [Mesobacillus subterraneus]KIY23118.1 hypothetical protein UB32_04505 [Mesobacillus subterraneus]